MEYLDAVNYQLSLLGSPPVGDLESNHPGVQTAVVKLTEAKRLIENKPWWFNMDYEVMLTPHETTKEIALPSDTLKLIATSRAGVIQRGIKLYDTINNTYQFDGAVYVNYMRSLEWDLLDDNVQDAIKYLAGAAICEEELEDFTKADRQREFYKAMLVQLKKDNLKIQRRNIMTTPNVARARFRVRPYRQYATGRNPIYPGG